MDDVGGGVLRLAQGADTGTIDWTTGAGEIDLITASTHAAAITGLTATANGQLVVPGVGMLAFGGLGANNAAYTLVANGSNTLRLLPHQLSVQIADGNQFRALATDLAGVLSGVAIQASVTLAAGNVVTTSAAGAAGLLAMPGSVQLSIQGAGGFVAAPGDVLALTGTNSFTGGVTILSGATVDLATATSAGAGTLTFAGTGAVLLLATPVNNPIAGMVPRDAIDLTSVV